MARGRLKMASERLVVNGIQVHLVRMARGRLKMARERLVVNGIQVHLVREAKIWPGRRSCIHCYSTRITTNWCVKSRDCD